MLKLTALNLNVCIYAECKNAMYQILNVSELMLFHAERFPPLDPP